MHGTGVGVNMAEGQSRASNRYGRNNEKSHRGTVCGIRRQVGFFARRITPDFHWDKTPLGIGGTFSPPKT